MTERVVIPDMDWYLRQSKERGLAPRCPFAVVTRYPRFYQSLSLLGEAGSTKIPQKEDEKLLRMWRKSPLWPVTEEQKTSVMGDDERKQIFLRFCPEAIFERFGLFASGLARYADDTDIHYAHVMLGKENASPRDWRWAWSHVEPEHYSQCQM